MQKKKVGVKKSVNVLQLHLYVTSYTFAFTLLETNFIHLHGV